MSHSMVAPIQLEKAEEEVEEVQLQQQAAIDALWDGVQPSRQNRSISSDALGKCREE